MRAVLLLALAGVGCPDGVWPQETRAFAKGRTSASCAAKTDSV